MNLSLITALVQKDFKLYFKNKLFAFLTILMLVFYVVIFYLLPNTVDETIEIAWFGPTLPGQFMTDLEAEGLILRMYASDAELQAAVQTGDELVGVMLPEDFVQQIRSGEKPRATIYVNSQIPEEFRGVYNLLIEEMSYFFSGQTLNIEAEEVVMGPDMAGQQIPPRQRMVPMLAVFLLIVEMMGLASLLTTEIEMGTIRALLVTPLSTVGLFISKGIAGILLIFSQVALIMAITGGFRNEPVLLAGTLLLGALMVTGLALLISSVSRDVLTVTAWSILAMFLLAIPSFNILMPGLTTQWIRVLPSYYLIDPVFRIINFNVPDWPKFGVNCWCCWRSRLRSTGWVSGLSGGGWYEPATYWYFAAKRVCSGTEEFHLHLWLSDASCFDTGAFPAFWLLF
jgi:ABC-2 type transport system permease protein